MFSGKQHSETQDMSSAEQVSGTNVTLAKQEQYSLAILY